MVGAVSAKRVRPRGVVLGAKLALALFLTLGLFEAALHAFPALLPAWYLELFPMHGVEFFRPGILERTPIEGLPLPIPLEPLSGPPPADLVELGLVPPSEDSDRRRFPRVEIPVDSLGFPNPRDVEDADLVILGDSMAVAAGARAPRGLQAELEEATGLRVSNLGVAGIGPVQEAWLLEEMALAKSPRCVVWLFFGGNDVTLSLEPFVHRQRGETTWAEAYADRRKPRLVLPDLVARSLARRPAARREPLPGVSFTLADGTAQPLWFNPFTLRQLEWTREQWQGNRGWIEVRAVLARARELCASRGIALVLVYVPPAEEVYLPHVEPDAARIHAMASFDLPHPVAAEPARFLAALLERRSSLEACVRDFCAENGIAFLSAVPALEALARKGELGYLVTDTHWQDAGQRAVLAPLVALLEREGVLE